MEPTKLVECCAVIQDYLSSFRSYLESWRALAHSTGDLMTAHLATSKELVEMQKQVLRAYADSNLSISENSERIDKLMAKMEKHFGSEAGLDYEN